MRIAFISDIHGSPSSLTRTLDAIDREGCDYIAILGDALYHGPRNPLPDGYNPPAVAEILNTLKEKVLAVRGNCDSEVDQMLIKYPMMGDYAIILDSGRRIFLSHGHLHTPENLPALSAGDIFAYGHTHLPVAEKKDGIFLFNPGSIAIPKGGNPPSYGIYDGTSIRVKSLAGDLLLECALN